MRLPGGTDYSLVIFATLAAVQQSSPQPGGRRHSVGETAPAARIGVAIGRCGAGYRRQVVPVCGRDVVWPLMVWRPPSPLSVRLFAL